MAVFQKFESFVAALATKAHDLETDVLTVALCNAANPPLAAEATLLDLTQIAYTNLSSRVVTVASATQVAGVLKLLVNVLTLTAAGGSVAPFRYVVLYNDTAANDELICFWDIGFEVTMADTDTFDLNFDQVNGVLQIS